MPVYKLTFPLDATGLDVEVVDERSGTVTSVESDPVTSPDGDLVYKVTLDESNYEGYAKTSTGVRAFATNVTLDIPASIAAASGGVGAAETAYFVATGATSADTAGGDPTPLVWVADSRHGDLPTWASVDGDDNIALTEDAGTCAFSFIGVCNFDFSATTPQGSGGSISNSFDLKFDDNQATISGASEPGDGQNHQVSTSQVGGGLTSGSVVTCQAYPTASDVADGTATPRAALTITRIAQAAVLPA